MTAIYDRLVHQPETPINEKWIWLSDVIVADDGSEQRISLSSLPKRNFNGSYVFDNEEDIRRHMFIMLQRFQAAFEWPVWPQMVVNKRRTAIGDLALFCNPRRSNFRVGEKFVIIEGDKYEVRTVAEVLPDRVKATVALTKAFTKRAVIVPIVNVYSSGSPTIKRLAHNKSGEASFDLSEVLPQDPFLAEDQVAFMPVFEELPVLHHRPYGNDYTQNLVTGVEAQDYGGAAYLRSRWNYAQWSQSLSYSVDRISDVEGWFYWLTFFDYCRGSTNPFFLAQFRDDVVVRQVANPSQIDFEGDEYYQNFFLSEDERYRRIIIRSETGALHYAKVTNVGQSLRLDGTRDSYITFDPPLPDGDWTEATVGFLLKCRIADDTVSITHTGVTSMISINVRTVVDFVQPQVVGPVG